MIIILIIQLLCVVLLVILDIVLIRSILFGAPYAPTSPKALQTMLALADIKPGDTAVDLGSGDGRLVIALAKAGAEAHGYETNWLLVWWSRWRIRQAGVQQRAKIHHRSYWHESLTQYQVVTVFGIPYIMERLETKLRNELSLGARVITNSFTFPHWPPKQTRERVYCYEQTSLLH